MAAKARKLVVLLLFSFLACGQFAFAIVSGCPEWRGIAYECSCGGSQHRVFIYVCSGIDGVGCDYGGGMETDCGACQIIDAEVAPCGYSPARRAGLFINEKDLVPKDLSIQVAGTRLAQCNSSALVESWVKEHPIVRRMEARLSGR